MAQFQLADGQLTPVVPDTSVTATFADDGISGSGGCNRYQGAYTLDGDTLTINVPPHTLMKCGGPDGVIEQEQIFLANLAVTTRPGADRRRPAVVKRRGRDRCSRLALNSHD